MHSRGRGRVGTNTPTVDEDCMDSEQGLVLVHTARSTGRWKVSLKTRSEV
jgi:hypothetical protein